MTEHKPTDEQIAIFNFAKGGKGHLLIDALAGSGKTSTVLQCVQLVPQKSVLMCAFNKPIAEELEERMGKAPPGSIWKAGTFHSQGLKIVTSHRPRLDIRKEATEDLINDAASEYEASAISTGSNRRAARVAFSVRRAAVKLLITMKETQTDKQLEHDLVLGLGHTYNHFGKLSADECEIAVELALRAYVTSQDLRARRAIDFCDMTWLPVVLDLAPPSRYQMVFVDEAQDLSLPQLKLVKKLVAPNGRLVVIGDLRQAIYKWRGAVGSDVWKEMKETFKATSLPLTTTFRCSKAVVKTANRIVPQLRAMPNAPEGDIYDCSFEGLPKLVKDLAGEGTSFILSRNNSDLLHTALFLWKADVGFQLRAGKEIVEPLYDIIDKLDKTTSNRFSASLTTWYQVEMGKAEAIHATAWADVIEQQHKSLQMMLEYTEPSRFKDVLNDILKLGAMSTITLSTVHKVKGLEADRVFLLKQTFARYRAERDLEEAIDDWQVRRARERLANIDPEELNLEYVAITRAKRDLYWVDMRGTGTVTLSRLYDVKGEIKPSNLSSLPDDEVEV